MEDGEVRMTYSLWRGSAAARLKRARSGEVTVLATAAGAGSGLRRASSGEATVLAAAAEAETGAGPELGPGPLASSLGRHSV
jgi:hypothetical protein